MHRVFCRVGVASDEKCNPVETVAVRVEKQAESFFIALLAAPNGGALVCCISRRAQSVQPWLGFEIVFYLTTMRRGLKRFPFSLGLNLRRYRKTGMPVILN